MIARRIIFFSHSSELSGAPKCLLELVESIERSRYLPIVVTPEKGPLIQGLRKVNVEVKIIKGIERLSIQNRNPVLKLFFLWRRTLLNFYLTFQTYRLI